MRSFANGTPSLLEGLSQAVSRLVPNRSHPGHIELGKSFVPHVNRQTGIICYKKVDSETDEEVASRETGGAAKGWMTDR